MSGVRIRPGALGELLRYGVAGAVNSLVGYGVFILALDGLALQPQWANAVGYAIGLCMAFVLNRYFVFAGARFSWNAAMRFLLCFGVAFAVNQLVLAGLLHAGLAGPRIAQLFAMAAYTVVFYVLNKHVVWVAGAAGEQRRD